MTVRRAAAHLGAVLAPGALTAVLLYLGGELGRDYVFLYMGLVAITALVAGLVPALLAAAVSFVAVDWFFVAPRGTLSISDPQDIVDLVVLFGTAGLVGVLASIRRRSLNRTQELARQLQRANIEQAEAAEMQLRLARTESQVRNLEERGREQRELIANVSHDLRTPLGTILTASTALLQRDSLEPEVRERLETVASEVRRLNHLVANTLDLARIDAQVIRLDLEPVSVLEAATAAAERLQQTSPGRTVECVGDADLRVLADWGRLGQVLDNLLANADRYSPPAMPIVVSVENGGPGVVRTRVVDSGPGVAPGLRGSMFERFAQAPDGDGDHGTGLGLAIVRGLVEAQAGAVTYDDAPGGGAAFTVTLPRAEAASG